MNPDGRTGRITLDILDETPDHDANAYKTYEED